METVHLKVGAQVMLISNMDTEKGLVNGSRGVVTGFAKYIKGHYIKIGRASCRERV